MTVHQWLDRCVVSVCVCVCVDSVHTGFYISLSYSHQSGGDTGEIKSLYEGLSLLPGPVAPLIIIKYFSSSNVTRDSEDTTTSSYTAPLKTSFIPPDADASNQSMKITEGSLVRHNKPCFHWAVQFGSVPYTIICISTVKNRGGGKKLTHRTNSIFCVTELCLFIDTKYRYFLK